MTDLADVSTIATVKFVSQVISRIAAVLPIYAQVRCIITSS